MDDYGGQTVILNFEIDYCSAGGYGDTCSRIEIRSSSLPSMAETDDACWWDESWFYIREREIV